MKTIRGSWKIVSLILALLLLGMTPAAAQNPTAQTPEQYIPFVGTGPSVEQAIAEKSVKEDKLDRKADRFVSQLERDGFVVQEGELGEFPLSHYSKGSCRKTSCCSSRPMSEQN